MKTFIICLFLGISYSSYSQKPAIDTSVYRGWPTLDGIRISPDGRHVFYVVENETIGIFTIHVKPVDNSWEKIFPDCRYADFSPSSRFLVINSPKGVIVFNLQTGEAKESSGFFLKKQGLLIRRSVEKPKRLVLENIDSGNIHLIDDVSEYRPIEETDALLLTDETDTANNIRTFKWYDLVAKKAISFASGVELGNEIASADGRMIAFVLSAGDSGKNKAICTYRYPEASAKQMFDLGTLKGKQLQRLQSFCANDKTVMLELIDVFNNSRKDPELVDLNIWSYKDDILQSQQLHSPPPSYKYLLDINTGKLAALPEGNAGFALLSKEGSRTWVQQSIWHVVKGRSEPVIETFAVSLTNGTRLPIKGKFFASPAEKYFIIFDETEDDYYSYEIATGIKRNITGSIKAKWMRGLRGVAGWTANDEALILYDWYDIWKLDPLGKKAPLNLTRSFGKNNTTRLSLLINNNKSAPLDLNAIYFLCGFNENTKLNGFYSMRLGAAQKPLELYKGDYLFYAPFANEESAAPVKAEQASTYVVKRTSAAESPNYFLTKDFKKFTQLSFLNPEKKYNWLTTELHTYNKGKNYKGILYKPENFDSTKKYPVILYYYEKLSDELNWYMKPRFASYSVDIPTFVSRGYLVFCPDIYYELEYPGESALQCVTAAGKYLQGLQFVDGQNMGVAGHSYGGYETNYIVTHTNMFKAACSAAGPTDYVSLYGSLNSGGEGRQTFVESGQPRLRRTLWESRDVYIRNSPLFDADKMNTPLLLMHGANDDAVPCDQAIEFFNALFRLNKKVWFLQYMNAGHTLFDDPKAQVDYTLRLEQFFDHFLKGAPPAKWMTQGRPAGFKWSDDYLQTDVSGNTP